MRSETTKATADRLMDTWLSGLSSDECGFLKRRPRLIARTRRVAKRLLNSPWSTRDELTRKDRFGNEDSDATARGLLDLRGAGLLGLAWDKNGMPHHAIAGTDLPAWLTISDSDDDLEALPSRK